MNREVMRSYNAIAIAAALMVIGVGIIVYLADRETHTNIDVITGAEYTRTQ